MFNEAFMFFWLIKLAGSLPALFLVFGVACAVVLGFRATMHYEEAGRIRRYGQKEKKNREAEVEWEAKGLRSVYKAVASVIVASLLAVAIPPESAFYAGAGQYVGTEVELDETLLRLKTVVDARIEELMPKQVEVEGNGD